jgi:hypothetical protein
MTNSGSPVDLSVGFYCIILFMLPIVLTFAGGVFWAIAACIPDVVYIEKKSVAESLPPIPTNNTPKPQITPVQVSPVVQKNTTTSNEVISETIVTLKNLGYSLKDAKGIVSQLASQRLYTDSEDLLKDCLSSI